MGLREIARILELNARVAGEIAGAEVNINIAAFPIERLSDDQADELQRQLTARRMNRLIPKEEQAKIAVRIEDAAINMLYDAKKREYLRARLDVVETTKH